MFRNRKSSPSGRPNSRGPRSLNRSVQLEALEERKLLSAAEIIAENALPGSSWEEWDIDGSGSDNIQGFAAQFSINQGERVDFKIDTDADDYRIDIYRMGWYDGDGARKVATINPNAALANNQPDPIVDWDTGLVDAGNWRVSASWQTTQANVSGVYFAKLTREDGVFGESHIVFVVRDDDGQSDILFQTSDTTWVAYSDWGGSSLYGNNFLPYGRAYEVSYNRPLTTRSRTESNFFFGSEYPMVRFLEANGYDVSYSSGIDTDRRGEELLEHKLFMSVGHDEYWSGQQRANVEAARDAGVNLAFFSGNEMFWKTRWEDSIDGKNTPYTTLVSYKETHANAKSDPLDGVWTGTWRDPRFAATTDGGNPENALTGTMFSVNGDSIIGRPMRVTAVEGQMRFWRDTEVADLRNNQSMLLGDYVLGYEWDEDVDNGFRPPGLMRLSDSTYQVSAYIQDYGNTYAKGTATHHMTLYRAASGALVFGAGTIQYSWGLDDFHDGPYSPADRNMQQATINLFADMGIQPEDLQAGLKRATMSTDFTAPSSTITNPLDGRVVEAGTTLTIRGTASDGGGGRVAGVEISFDGGTRWHPVDGLGDWSYTWTARTNGRITILTRAVDDSGNLEVPGPGVVLNPLADTGVYSFWDGDARPATIDSGDNAAVEVGVRFRVDTAGFVSAVRFYKAAANTGTHVAHLWTESGQLLASATFTNETGSGWQEVEFDAPIPVSAGVTYIASYTAPRGRYSMTRGYFIGAGVDNGPLHSSGMGMDGGNGVYSYGNGQFPNQTYQGTNYWVDVVVNTAMASDVTAPIVTKFGQTGNQQVVSVGSAFTITFSEAVNPATVNVGTVTLVKPDSRMIPGGCCPTPGGWCSGCPLLNGVNNTTIASTVTYDTATRTATIRPNAPLDPSTVYTIIVNGGGVQDLAGNAIEIDTWSSVYTSNQPAPVTNTYFAPNTVPPTVDGGDTAAVELGMRFTADTDGFVTGARFYKAAANTGTHTATLWTANGQKLATATFTNETASGWQQVSFNAPVAITAGTTYVISYHTNSGRYSFSRNFFGSANNSGVINTPANAGVYAYGSGSNFPSSSYQGTNYYVDVVLSSAPTTDTLAPSITNFFPFHGTPNVGVNPSVQVNFSEAMDASTILPATVKLLDANLNAVPATLSYNAGTRTATLTPTSQLAYGMNYTIFVMGGTGGVRDLAGNTMAQNNTATFSTEVGDLKDNVAPDVASFSPGNGASNVNPNAPIQITFTEPLNAATVRWNNVYLLIDGTRLVDTTLTYDAATRTATLVPAEPLAPSTSYTIFLRGGSAGVRDLFNNALEGNRQAVFTTSGASDTTAPTITGVSPSGTNVGLNAPVSIHFSEPLNPSSVNGTTVQLRNASSGAVIAASLSYTAGGTVVTLTPTNPLSPSTNYSIVVQGGASGVKDLAGNALGSTATFGFTTVPPADTTAPTITGTNPASGSTGISIGTAITISLSEALSSSTVTGTTVQLRNTSTGAVIAATLSYTAGSTIITLIPSSPLSSSTSYSIVVQGGPSGLKDVAGNALASTFTASFSTAAAGDTTPPVVTGFSPTAGSTGVSIGTAATITFNEAMNASTIDSSTVFLRNASGTVIAGTVAYNATTRTATITPTGPLANSTTYTIVAKGGAAGVKDAAGNALASDALSSFTTVAPADTTAPTVTSFNPASGATNVAIGTSITIAFSEALNASTVNSTTISLRNASGATVAATVTYNASNNTITVTPNAPLANSTTYTVVVKGGAAGVKDVAGNAVASDVSSSFTTAAAPSTILSSLWPTPPSPATLDGGDTQAVELGVKFTSTTDGYITAIRFYKAAANTGTHTGSLWSASGQLLARVTFTGESASGWQTATFSQPVAITAGATYTASYFAPRGHYSVSRNYFSSAFTSGPLRVVANGGVYRYGSSSAFPSSSYQGSNYWVDVVMSSTPPVDNTPPTVTGATPASGASNVLTSASPSVTFSEALNAATVNSSTVFLRNAAGQVIPTTVTYNAANRTATLTPTAALANATTYTIVVKGGASGVKDAAGNALAGDFLSSFSTRAAGLITSSMWNSSTTPATVDSGDTDAVELGVRFTATTNGYVTGVRFYKSAANTGTHTASLWTSGGQLLARATFVNETASGWQEVLFDTPIAITAGTTYVASYHAPNGRYSVDRNYFSRAITAGSLRVPAGGGVYSYGSSSSFPSGSYQGSNYWVDVLFGVE